MEVKIGVQHSPRELVIDSPKTPEEIAADVTCGLRSTHLIAASGAPSCRARLNANRLFPLRLPPPISTIKDASPVLPLSHTSRRPLISGKRSAVVHMRVGSPPEVLKHRFSR